MNQAYKIFKKMKPGIFLIVLTELLSTTGGVVAQEPVLLTIDECYDRAEKAYPLRKNRATYEQESELKAKNISTGYFPQMTFNAEAKYLSEVIDLNTVLPIPGFSIPSPPKDQFNFFVTLNQLIFDGGIIKNKKAIEESLVLTNTQALEADLYQLRGRVNLVYFSILFQQYNDSLFALSVKELKERIRIGSSAVQNGTMLQADLDILKAEQVRLEQNIIENIFNIRKSLGYLGTLIDSVLTENTILTRPGIILDFESPINRPETKLLTYQKQQLDLKKKLATSMRMPKISGFGQLGYGQPGLNPLNENFAGYYILGVRLSWNIFDWNQARRDKDVLGLNQMRLDYQLETFNHNLDLELGREREDIQKFKAMILKDDELISLRERILLSSASKLDNGVLQAADYVRDFNQCMTARIKQNIHELFLLQAKFNYSTLKGNTLNNDDL